MSRKGLLAAFLSFFLAGLGQMYLRSFSRGLVFLAAEGLTGWLYLTYENPLFFALNLLVSLVAAFDAYKLASKKRVEEKESQTQRKQELKAF
ncbi:MAG: hypothetical protein GF334_13640 [Candidatus Altiarchaeales archaeon]|nr:hypothetical protein [Candidatus Altiarchaeales archaeon]